MGRRGKTTRTVATFDDSVKSRGWSIVTRDEGFRESSTAPPVNQARAASRMGRTHGNGSVENQQGGASGGVTGAESGYNDEPSGFHFQASGVMQRTLGSFGRRLNPQRLPSARAQSTQHRRASNVLAVPLALANGS